jgi:sRNA-binding protein
VIARNGAGLNHDGGEAREIKNDTRSFSPPAPQASSKRQERIEAALGVLVILRQRWPLIFARSSARARRPLKVGIASDLKTALPNIPPVLISVSLAIYANSASYFAACTAGAARIDLDGKPAGVVSADEAAYAREKLQRPKKQKPSPAPSPRRVTLNDLRAAAARRQTGAAS